MRRVSLTLSLVIVLIAWHPFASVDRVHGQARARVQAVAPKTTGAHRDWDNTVNSMVRTKELRVRLQRADTLISVYLEIQNFDCQRISRLGTINKKRAG